MPNFRYILCQIITGKWLIMVETYISYVLISRRNNTVSLCPDADAADVSMGTHLCHQQHLFQNTLRILDAFRRHEM
jgi:hypothetical protein